MGGREHILRLPAGGVHELFVQYVLAPEADYLKGFTQSLSVTDYSNVATSETAASCAVSQVKLECIETGLDQSICFAASLSLTFASCSPACLPVISPKTSASVRLFDASLLARHAAGCRRPLRTQRGYQGLFYHQDRSWAPPTM